MVCVCDVDLCQFSRVKKIQHGARDEVNPEQGKLQMVVKDSKRNATSVSDIAHTASGKSTPEGTKPGALPTAYLQRHRLLL